ncbi:ATP-dependent helicase [Bacillus tropicus]|uniref:ATP-dependent helicase n=1 Tax=Bacillus tropicus TaxID=2026188 RepID=UPI00159B9710|nr:ATP-dependent helicase [Bacillus tropicus]MDE7551389.1 ATP-dependent helicase [Bacillus tropicus]MDE7572835.1 ATP-dependent helicase [Bacillus tropicus]
MIQKSLTTHIPTSVSSTIIPKADSAHNVTSKQIVQSNEFDAPYFRKLEAQGIYLNNNQIKAVRSTDGPILTLAGAGSGKTAVLAARTGYLLCVKKIKPQNILIVTFTKKAADEIKTRIASYPGVTEKMANSLITGTFHSVFLRLLRSIGYHQKILSSEKQKEIIVKGIIKEIGIGDKYNSETLLANFSYISNTLVISKHSQENTIDDDILESYKRYSNYKQKNDLMDFDDILYFTYEVLISRPSILTALQNRFKYIEVDEYQDTSILQHEIMKRLAAPHNNFFIVGDDNQSIYQFRAASADIILNFPNEYPACQKIILDINYRSNYYIVGLGNEIIKHNQKRFDKTLLTIREDGSMPYYISNRTTEEEAKNIIQKIKQDVLHYKKRDWGDIAVLYRTHAVSRSLTDQLSLQDIPFIKFGKEDLFYENPIVKKVLDFLRLSLDNNDITALKCVLPPLYLKREKALEHIAINFDPNLTEKSALSLLLTYRDITQKQLSILSEKVLTIKKISSLTPVEAMQAIRFSCIGYEKYLLNNDIQTPTNYQEMIKETLDELEDSARGFITILDYLKFIDKIINKHKKMEKLKEQKNSNAVKLMTIHSSKGLEFPVVYLIGASETIIPHSSALDDRTDRISNLPKVERIDEAIEEERRLMYVGVTRAKEELYICSPTNYRNKEVGISRFILEAFQ